jgi:hypothetical protein
MILAWVATDPDASLALTATSVVPAMVRPLLFALGCQRLLARGLIAAPGRT